MSRRMNPKFMIFVFTVLTAANALAIINGTAVSDHDYNAVGSLYINGEQSCTVTLVHDRWIVTADHCAHATDDAGEEGGGEPLPPESYEIRFGFDSKKPVYTTHLKRWVHGPQVSEDYQADIAFGELAVPVPSALNILPISTARANFAQPVAEAIGYGVRAFYDPDENARPLRFQRQRAQLTLKSDTGNALINILMSPRGIEHYIRQHHTNEIDLDEEPIEQIITRAELRTGYQLHAWDNRGRENPDYAEVSAPTEGWQDTCFGDSGGPLLQRGSQGLKIIGVVSTGLNRTCATMGTIFTTFNNITLPF